MPQRWQGSLVLQQAGAFEMTWKWLENPWWCSETWCQFRKWSPFEFRGKLVGHLIHIYIYTHIHGGFLVPGVPQMDGLFHGQSHPEMDDRGTHIYPLFSSHGGIHLQLITRKMWGKVVVDKTRALNCNGLQFYLRIQHFLPELMIWMPNSNRFILQHDQTLYYTLSNTGGFCIKVCRRFPNPPHGGFRFVMTGYPQSSSDRTMGFPRKKNSPFWIPHDYS